MPKKGEREREKEVGRREGEAGRRKKRKKERVRRGIKEITAR